MNGIEKITQRIDADTQAEIDRILADARETRLRSARLTSAAPTISAAMVPTRET